VPRPTAKESRVRFDHRFRARIEVICATRTVRDALAAIQNDVMARWREGRPFATEPPKRGRATPEPCWYEHWLCRQAGVVVGIEDRGREVVPMLLLSLTTKAALEGRAARVKFPQNLLEEREYDLWEISRTAPLSQIIEDVTVEWGELQTQRERRGARFRASRRRGSSAVRQALALEAYRKRLNGHSWAEVAQAVGKSSSSIRAAVADVCAATGLPRPDRGTSIPELPASDCDRCPKRRSPSQACADCPVIAHLRRFLSDYEE
jgi:hypothetical protein